MIELTTGSWTLDSLLKLFDKTKEMREMQKAFFATHAKSALNASKRLEKEVDTIILELENSGGIIKAKPVQTTLL